MSRDRCGCAVIKVVVTLLIDVDILPSNDSQEREIHFQEKKLISKLASKQESNQGRGGREACLEIYVSRYSSTSFQEKERIYSFF